MPEKVEVDFQQLLADNLPFEQERAALEGWVRKNPQAAPALLPALLTQKHRYKQMLDDLTRKLGESPWYPATFLRMLTRKPEYALVAMGNRRFSVLLTPDIPPSDLKCGMTVLLNHEMKVLLGVADDLPHTGQIGVLARFHKGRAVLKTAGDEELVLDVAVEARDQLQKGDQVLFDRETLMVFEKIESASGEMEILSELTADTSIGELGGLDAVYGDIVEELKLHLFNAQLAETFKLNPVKGILLSGPPGVGKTSLVKAVARHFSSAGEVQVKVLLAKPGIHRSVWFGVSENRARALFEEAKKAAEPRNQFVFLFFDDVDQLGSRDDRINAIDSRILPCFLQEIDALRTTPRIMLIGATNREDLLDEALLRPGRFGDRFFRIPRPSREAAREILLKLLSSDLPFYTNTNGHGSPVESIVAEVLAATFAPNGEQRILASLTFRDGSRRPLTAADIMSGAVLSNVVAGAKRRGCFRALHGGTVGLTSNDVLSAMDDEVAAIVQRLKPGPTLHQMLDLPPDLDVVRIETPRRRAARNHEYIQRYTQPSSE